MDIEHQKEVPLAAVIGSPIAQSLSPDLHNYWLLKNNLKGYYIPLNVSLQMLEKTINLLPKLGFKGANVTIPHKTNVLSMVDKLTDRAAMIGAVNTLHFNSSGQITGDNTDAYGFIENIKQKQPHWNPKKGPALVYGAGGAARAIVWALLHEGVPEVRELRQLWYSHENCSATQGESGLGAATKSVYAKQLIVVFFSNTSGQTKN